jgi:hypothetical protein
MSRHGSRRGERVQTEKPAPAAEPAAAAAAAPEGPAAPAGPSGLHWTWKLTTVVWGATFLFLLLYEWGGTVYRMLTVKP